MESVSTDDVNGPATLEECMTKIVDVLQDTDQYEDISAVSFDQVQEEAILVVIESLCDSGTLQSLTDPLGSESIFLSDEYINGQANINTDSMFDFVDILSVILSDPAIIRKCHWRVHLLERIGGLRSLERLWEKLFSMKASKFSTKKRKHEDDDGAAVPKKPKLE